MTAVSNDVVLRVLQVSGGPAQRGRQQGEELRSPIEIGVGRWLEAIGVRHGIDPDAYIAEFLSKTAYRDSIERWTPELLVEIHGIAQGSGQSVERMLAYSMLDEEWRYSRTRAADEAPGCTAVGIRADGGRPTLMGQTMDIPSVHDDTQVVVIHEEQGAPTQAVFTAAGMIGLMGVNSAGVGVCVNNLDVLPAARSGVPVTFIERKLLDTFSVDEASYALGAMHHTIGQHYLIGDSTHLTSFEVDATRIVAGGEDQAVIAHANHPVYDPPAKAELEKIYARSRSRDRMSCIAATTAGVTTLEGIEAGLSDATVPISRATSHGFMTFGAMVAELSSPPRVRFAPGPPHERPFVEVEVPVGGEVNEKSKA